MKLLPIDENLILEEIDVFMAKALFEAIEQYRESLYRWLPFIDALLTIEHCRLFLEEVSAPNNQRELVFCIRYREKLAGLIALKDIDPVNKKAELGYWLLPPFEGKGIMTRACKKLIRYSFQKLKLHRLTIKTAEGNFRSEALAQRLNFEFEGIEKDGEKHREGYRNLKIFSLIQSH